MPTTWFGPAFLPKCGRRLTVVGWYWHNGKGRVIWGQQPSSCPSWPWSEYCSYSVHGCPAALEGAPVPPTVAPVARTTVGRGGGHAGVARRGLGHGPPSQHRDPHRRWPLRLCAHRRGSTCTGPAFGSASCAATLSCECPTPGRAPAGSAARTRIPDLSTIDLRDEGKQLYHTWLYYKLFKSLLQGHCFTFVENGSVPEPDKRPCTLGLTSFNQERTSRHVFHGSP